jgi:hypothetical protein
VVVVCLSIAHSETRCAGHCKEALAAALGEYVSRWPGGPETVVLVAAEIRISKLHGHAALARAWARTAHTDFDRQRADAYATAAQDRLATVRAARAGGAVRLGCR